MDKNLYKMDMETVWEVRKIVLAEIHQRIEMGYDFENIVINNKTTKGLPEAREVIRILARDDIIEEIEPNFYRVKEEYYNYKRERLNE